jgi:hypothetical protein
MRIKVFRRFVPRDVFVKKGFEDSVGDAQR